MKHTTLKYDNRLRTLLIKEIIYSRTDNAHSISAAEIIRIMDEEYGLLIARQTVYSDIEKLIDAGYDIVCERGTQNRYYVASRDFDLAEIKMMLDLIEASKSLSYTRSMSMANKIANLAGPCAAEYLLKTVNIDARNKTENNQVCYIVETVYEAIAKKRKIMFTYYEYLADKTRVNKHNGEDYIVSPYRLAMSGDFYYLIGYSEKHKKIATFRVDRISGIPKVIEVDTVPVPMDFAVSDYINDSFRSFSGEKTQVELIFTSNLMDNLVDRFGESINITSIKGDVCTCTIDTVLSNAFYAWVFGFEGKVRIMGPTTVKDYYLRLVSKEMARL